MKRGHLWLALAGVLLLGGAVRALFLTESRRNHWTDIRNSDAEFHDYWARGLSTGDWSLPDGYDEMLVRQMAYLAPPGYPHLLGLIYRLTEPRPIAGRLAQLGLGLVNCVLAFWLGRCWFGTAVGLLFAVLMAAYWPFVFFEGQLLPPILVITLSLVLLSVLARWADRPRLRHGPVAGLVLGALLLVKPALVMFAPVAAVWLAWVAHRQRQGRQLRYMLAGYAIGVVLAVSPATIRNFVVARDSVMVSCDTGIVLYMGNNEQADGIEPALPGLISLTGSDEWTYLDYDRLARSIGVGGSQATASDVSWHFADKAVEYVLRNPARTLALVGRKTLLFWGPRETSENQAVHYVHQNSRVLGYMPLGFSTVLAAAVLGAAMLWQDRRESRSADGTVAAAARRRHEVFVLSVLFVLTYFLSSLPFLVASCDRTPIVPFLLLFGAYGTCRFAGWLRFRSWRPVATLAVLFAAVHVVTALDLAGYQLDPAGWHCELASAYRRNGQLDRAVDEYRKALDCRPDLAPAHLGLGLLFSEHGSLDEAVVHLTHAVRMKPDCARAHAELGWVRAQQGATQEAVLHYYTALQTRPGLATVHNRLGAALADQDTLDAAVAQYRQALRAQPDYVPAHYNLSLALKALGMYEEAISHLERVLRTRPNDAQVHFELAIVLTSTGNTNEAILHYEEAVRIDPSRADAHTNLGLALSQRGDLADAIVHYRRAIEIQPDHALAHYNLGGALAQQGRNREALRHYRRAVQLRPNHDVMLDSLAWLLATTSDQEVRNPLQAVTLAERACEVAGHDNPRLLDTLAAAYAAAGRFDDAVATASRAVELAVSLGQIDYARQIRSHLQRYQSGRSLP